jgi:hypothetical protein
METITTATNLVIALKEGSQLGHLLHGETGRQVHCVSLIVVHGGLAGLVGFRSVD